MTFRDWFLFISTFAIAILCGMYLYFTTFVPEYVANPAVQELAEKTQPDWTIGVRVYGGCDRGDSCPAFSVDSKGKYRYQPTPDTAIQDGRLPSGLRSAYADALTTVSLVELAAPSTSSNCQSYLDGLDYALQVDTREGSYLLDTCQTQLDYDARLLQLVRETVVYLDNPATYQPSATSSANRAGLDSYFERKLDEIFDYDEQ